MSVSGKSRVFRVVGFLAVLGAGVAIGLFLRADQLVSLKMARSLR